MRREDLLARLEGEGEFDLAVVGGGATGLGVGVEAASRGYRTVLLEQHDFCTETSSKSTKLIHGGVRYLSQGNFSLVVDALRERGLLLRNAPHLVKTLPLIVPAYRFWQRAYYGFGLKLYDLLSGRLRLGKTRVLSSDEVVRRIPTVSTRGLRGGVLFHDGQFDDARLGMALVRTMAALGGLPLNYLRAAGLLKSGSAVGGVRALDVLSGREYEVPAKVVINAAGPLSDELRTMAAPDVSPRISASRGSHVVLDRRFLGGSTALLVPQTDDGRVLFAIPWYDRVVAGTTDVPVDRPCLAPVPTESEIDFILAHLRRYLSVTPDRNDILSVFAGLRPLIAASGGGVAKTSVLSRDHTLEVLGERMISVLGGKWTTYRKMGEDTVNEAARLASLPPSVSNSRELRLWGAGDEFAHSPYGSDAPRLTELAASDPSLEAALHPALPYQRAVVVWAARHEWACTVEDVLARRTRSLILDARASLEAAPAVADLLAGELGRDAYWRQAQAAEFQKLARTYLPG
jgi:glycerol-3-phosphate dehydrogenase